MFSCVSEIVYDGFCISSLMPAAAAYSQIASRIFCGEEYLSYGEYAHAFKITEESLPSALDGAGIGCPSMRLTIAVSASFFVTSPFSDTTNGRRLLLNLKYMVSPIEYISDLISDSSPCASSGAIKRSRRLSSGLSRRLAS